MKKAIQLGKIVKMFASIIHDKAVAMGYIVSMSERGWVVQYEGRLYPLKG